MLATPTPSSPVALHPLKDSSSFKGSHRNDHDRVHRRADTPLPWFLAHSRRNMIPPGSSHGPWRGVATDPGFGPRCDVDGLRRSRYPAVGRGEARCGLAGNTAARLGPEDGPLAVGVPIGGDGPARVRWWPSLVYQLRCGSGRGETGGGSQDRHCVEEELHLVLWLVVSEGDVAGGVMVLSQGF
jgi:hypothetical protein